MVRNSFVRILSDIFITENIQASITDMETPVMSNAPKRILIDCSFIVENLKEDFAKFYDNLVRKMMTDIATKCISNCNLFYNAELLKMKWINSNGQ